MNRRELTDFLFSSMILLSENFLPKVDGVTRTLARLLEHLNAEGHDAIVLGPETGVKEYAGHAVVGTFGLPLIVYPGLKLNFTRPRFIRRLQQFKPDVCHFVDPIWLGAQMLPIVQTWLPDVPCVSSYHTNLPTYATLFGMPWLEETMWKLTRNLHSRCEMVFCPSNSTRSMLEEKGFKNVEIWSRGVDIGLFNPAARDENLRASWGCSPADATEQMDAGQQAAVGSLAAKLGLVVNTKPATRTSAVNGSPYDDSFIKTPPVGPSMFNSPELSPPPAYASLDEIPELSSSGFALPPPAIPSPLPFVHRYEGNDASAGQGKTVLLYVGRISWEKNIRLLIEAFRQLPTPVRSKAKLVVVGDGPARGELTRLCNKLQLDATFMGHQKGTRLAAMYASSDISAFPSHTETFGQVVLEALACGLPVVGLHAQGTSDLVTHGKTGLLLDVAKTARAGLKSASTPPSPATRASDRPRSLQSPTSSPNSMRPMYERGSPSFGTGSSMTKLARSSVPGLPVLIPTAADFAAAMNHNNPSAGFTSCARTYSMQLERLIRDRPLRLAMGRQAQLEASGKTWWDAMDAVVRGYEEVIRRRKEDAHQLREEDEEEESIDFRGSYKTTSLRNGRRPPLTGIEVRVAILVYLAAFVAFSCKAMLIVM